MKRNIDIELRELSNIYVVLLSKSNRNRTDTMNIQELLSRLIEITYRDYGCRVFVGQTYSNCLGQYEYRTQSIVLNQQIFSCSIETFLSVFFHELGHRYRHMDHKFKVVLDTYDAETEKYIELDADIVGFFLAQKHKEELGIQQFLYGCSYVNRTYGQDCKHWDWVKAKQTYHAMLCR